MEKIAQAWADAANYLLNNKLNQKFPPFVNLGVLGLNILARTIFSQK